MISGASLTAQIHRERSDSHLASARALIDQENTDWAAVALFYAAYHLVKAAFIEDPVFDDFDRLRSIEVTLTADDRYVTAHHGRRRPAISWGVNELVLKLYPQIAGSYERLHQASIDVRYGRGFKGSGEQLISRFEQIAAVREAGGLKA